MTLDFYSLEGVTYKCSGPGALLSISHDGKSRDIVLAKVFEEYIQIMRSAGLNGHRRTDLMSATWKS